MDEYGFDTMEEHMITYKLYLIRHGLTLGNLEGRYIGRTDPPLCREGENALKELKQNGEYPSVKKVYSSPMQRCLDTAEILYPDAPLMLVPELKEYDFGFLDGKSVEELKEDPRFIAWTDSGMRSVPSGGEDMNAFRLRCEEGFSRVVLDMMKQKITSAALILHSGMMMNLLAAHGYPKREPLRWQAGPGEGFALLLTTQLWHRDNVFEVFDVVPYRKETDAPRREYEVFDLEEEKQE